VTPTVIDATYDVPYLAHAPMEPLNATADVSADRAEIWVPTQNPASARRSVAAILRIPESAVHVNVTLAGGGFGRRGSPDVATEAARLCSAWARRCRWCGRATTTCATMITGPPATTSCAARSSLGPTAWPSTTRRAA